ncbi:PmoA family protein [Antribacter gilvus]|uniref:DUF6807 domain-containing protein n=1 Tax=Antribacter gilvus TaxID=2304675 RepID=UPI000F7B12A0|nr:PmoA family protein [Antribacter gilvus]
MTTTLHDDGARLTFGLADTGAGLFDYVYRPTDAQYESPRPYLHPMRTLAGDLVTVFRPWDHIWHKGLTLSLPNVGPWNFWGGPTYVRDEGYRDLGNDGSMDHEGFRSSGDGGFVEELAWRTPPASDATQGEVVVREVRTLAVTVADDAWVLTWSSELTNVSDGALDLGSPTTNGRENAGYGGLFWRGPRSFTGGTVIAPGFSGDAEDVRGERFGWMGFVGRHDGYTAGPGTSTVVMVDGGANPGGTPQWFVRSAPFAVLCPAPAFSEEVPFGPGETLTFSYAMVIADGESDEVRGEKLAALGASAL